MQLLPLNQKSDGVSPDVLFVSRLRNFGQRTAIVTDAGRLLTYAELADAVDAQAVLLCKPARLTIVEADNKVECVVAYLACLQAGYPVILSEPGSTMTDTRITTTYDVGIIFRDCGSGFRSETLEIKQHVPLHTDLCVLLSTSGTTGSPNLYVFPNQTFNPTPAQLLSIFASLHVTEQLLVCRCITPTACPFLIRIFMPALRYY